MLCIWIIGLELIGPDWLAQSNKTSAFFWRWHVYGAHADHGIARAHLIAINGLPPSERLALAMTEHRCRSLDRVSVLLGIIRLFDNGGRC